MNFVVGICSILFLSVGADKFLHLVEPPCSLEGNINSTIWKVFGVLQIAAGILIWFPKFRKSVSIFFFAFMLTFSVYHLIENTYDIGGSLFMAALLGIIIWNPNFLNVSKK